VLFRSYDNIDFIFSDEQNIMKVKEEINKLSDNAIIYYDARFKDEEGKNISQEKVSDILFKDIDIPVYSKSIEQLKYGSVGGVITYGSSLGQEIGKIVLRILDGEKIENIPITEDSSHRFTFNYDELKKFNIDTKVLPKDSEIINKPAKYYNISKKIIFYTTAFTICVIILIVVVINLNIHKRRLAERLLVENESLLSTLINSIPDIIYFKSDDDRFLELNNAALNLLNIDKKGYKNKSVHELTNLSKHAKSILISWTAKDELAWTTEAIHRSEEVILDAEEKGSKIFDTLRIPLFNDNGTRKGMVLLGRDITEKKQIEKNEQLIKDLLYYDKLKANFFSNISHELRTPLNLIFSTMQVIELRTNINKEDNRYLEKYIGIMRQNCYRLLRIINNLIDITKIDAGHFFTNFQNKDIVNIVENIVLSVADYVESKGISIVFDTEMEERITAFDLDAMERILLNLISNAIKFTPNGGSIEVNMYDRGNSIVISVKDSGIGIPIEKQVSIFEKFVQVDKSLSRNREGSGIGLSLVKELVGLHNGTIELDSAPGKGSEFRIILPVKLLDEEACSEELNTYTSEEKVERIKIEFSDIYN
jgi:PAS domain S-box-containing protein